MPIKFFQTFWSAIVHRVMALFEKFDVGSIDLHRLNYGIITLIPKGDPFGRRFTHPDQPAFIRGRYILDVVPVFPKVQAKHLKAICLKIDFHKAYDTVNWSFLREVLLRKWFNGCWINRVMEFV
ncbi:hypothetical protein D1007_47181 [Hordeum vulgare]|nr:hypothetical protein D1007_47181 [Hordeum vulgare]